MIPTHDQLARLESQMTMAKVEYEDSPSQSERGRTVETMAGSANGQPAITEHSSNGEAQQSHSKNHGTANGVDTEENGPRKPVTGDVDPPELPAKTCLSSDDSEEDLFAFEECLTDDIKYGDTVGSLLTAQPDHRLRNRQTLSYFMTMEARIRSLEDEIKDLRSERKTDDKDGQEPQPQLPAKEPISDEVAAETVKAAAAPSNDSNNKPEAVPDRWRLTPSWLSVRDFVVPPVVPERPQAIIDVLKEPMIYDLTPSSSSSGRKQKRHGLEPAVQTLPQQASKPEIHRLRINSTLVCEAFAVVMDKTRAPEAGEIQIRPFKAILAYHQQLRQHLSRLNTKVEALEEANQTRSDHAGLSEPGTGYDDDKGSTAGGLDEPVDDSDDHLIESRKHLLAFLTFVEEHLAADLASYRKFRLSDKADGIPRVTFADLWKVYAPGDLVYDSQAQQVSRVLTVHNGRKRLRYRATSEDRTRAGEGDITAMVVTCFHLDFDGTEFGPVEEELVIEPYDGTRSVLQLRAYPIAYLELTDDLSDPSLRDPTAKTRQDTIAERGQQFCKLAKASKVAHKDYEGLSADPAPEHIDSEIIVDLERYYQGEKSAQGERAARPKIGLSECDESDFSETYESYRGGHCPCSDLSCTLMTEIPSKLYADWKVDEDLKAQHKSPSVADYYNGNVDISRAEYAILFPYKIHAFVLKTREWHAVDIDNISELEANKQNFEDLILPDEHKDIVKGLVDMHSGGQKDVEGSTAPRNRKVMSHLSQDLVRGKGRGLIVLLHGVPGVGKTSTAECVAERTGRPLYALTCGDIGETPSTVQDNLQKAFALAYRWGCVLLLDEADVFLAERDRTDMTRNAVVSVFLRTLEYYSGILFLTTNKVGVFDEAFKSRIHVSLYYQPLGPEQSKKIWQVNLRRAKEHKPELEFDEPRILIWVDKLYREDEDAGRLPWNGRQIHNAVRTAVALAAFQEEEQGKNHLRVKHLKKVAKASSEFDSYLVQTHGQDDASLAHNASARMDPRKADLYQESNGRPNGTRARNSQDQYDRNQGLDRFSERERRQQYRTPPQPARQERRSERSAYQDDGDEEEKYTSPQHRDTRAGARQDSKLGMDSDDE